MAEHHHFPSRTLEITVLSGEDLRIYRRSVKKNAFVVVRTDTNKFQTTEIDGGSYPSWNEKFLLGLPSHAHGVTLEVHCKTAFGNIIVGAASVPVSDIVGGYVPETHLRFLSYRLRDSRGGRNGIINISVRMKVPAAEEYPHWAGRSIRAWCRPGRMTLEALSVGFRFGRVREATEGSFGLDWCRAHKAAHKAYDLQLCCDLYK